MYIVLPIKISSICLCAVFAGMGNILDTNPEFLGRVLDVSPFLDKLSIDHKFMKPITHTPKPHPTFKRGFLKTDCWLLQCALQFLWVAYNIVVKGNILTSAQYKDYMICVSTETWEPKAASSRASPGLALPKRTHSRITTYVLGSNESNFMQFFHESKALFFFLS